MMEGEQIIKPGDPQNGMLVDFQNVKGIIDALDHSDLNILFNEDEPPTAENIARYLGYQLYRLQDNIHRVIVHIWESEDSFIEWDSETDLELDYKIKESLTESLSDVKTPEDVSKQREANKDILNGDSDESESQ
jgi:6-pyruvoyl-tetrahydropterin synthase